MGGAPVFAGTRVPIQTFLECLAGGESIGDFLQAYPSVTREQLVAFLMEIENNITAKAG